MSVDFVYSTALLHLEITDDILQTVSDEQVEQLCRMYKEKHWPYAAQAYYFLEHMLSWKCKKHETGIRFTCPEGNWQDGTFLAIVTEYTYNVWFFTLEKDARKLSEILKQTKLIDWEKGPYICAIHDDHDKVVMQSLRQLGEIKFEIESTCFILSQEIGINLEINCPNNVYIASLRIDQAKFINSVWTHSFPNSEIYVANLLKMNGGYGVYQKSTDELCCWITTNDFGAHAILQTLDKHKRKGYAALLVKTLAKDRARRGLGSVTYIVRTNFVSQNLFKGIGFRLNNLIRWVQFNPPRDGQRAHL